MTHNTTPRQAADRRGAAAHPLTKAVAAVLLAAARARAARGGGEAANPGTERPAFAVAGKGRAPAKGPRRKQARRARRDEG